MDSNPTRRGRKAKCLTRNQFIRHLSSVPDIHNMKAEVQIAPIVYIMMLAQCTFDLKSLGRSDDNKYPLAIMYFAVYKLLAFYGRKFEVEESVIEHGTNYYISLQSIEKLVGKLTGQMTFFLFGVTEAVDSLLLYKRLTELGTHIADLSASLGYQQGYLFYLATMYFKELTLGNRLYSTEGVMDRIAGIRTLYLDMPREDKRKVGKVEEYLIKKFEDLI